ncbi:MAG: hypothetical protein AMXMBFR64_25060 [Myxococcales bacterium]
MKRGPKSLIVRGARLIAAVARSFHANHGFLLAAAVAFQTLLSLIPLVLLLVVGLSHLVAPQRLMDGIVGTVGSVLPGQVELIQGIVASFLENRSLLGGFGILSLLFFSSLAFTVLEESLFVLFSHRPPRKRHFLISAIMPYAFIMIIALGLLLTTVAVGFVEAISDREVHLLGTSFSARGVTSDLLRAAILVGEVALLTSFYHYLPVGRTRWSHALVGALLATVLWELMRRVLGWYYGSVSQVSLFYGSITTVVVTLLTLQFGAITLLLGAQVIAELEKATDAQRSAEGT